MNKRQRKKNVKKYWKIFKANREKYGYPRDMQEGKILYMNFRYAFGAVRGDFRQAIKDMRINTVILKRWSI